MVTRSRLNKVKKHLKSDMKRWKKLSKEAEKEYMEDKKLLREL